MNEPTLHAKSKCKAKDPSTCPYHGTPTSHAAADLAAREAAEAAQRGDTSAYLEAKAREEDHAKQARAEELARGGDTVLDLEEVKSQATRLFQSVAASIRTLTNGKRSTHTHLSPFTDEQIQAGRAKLRLEEETALNRKLRKQELDLIMRGDIDPFTWEEKQEFHNPELKNLDLTLHGWKPANETHEYVVRELMKAVLDQKDAAFTFADALKAEDGFHEYVAKAEDGEPGGKLSNFDEGWLHTFAIAAKDAKTTAFVNHSTEAEKRKALRTFITRHHNQARDRDELKPNSFNAGAHQAWADWLNTMDDEDERASN